MLNRLICQLLFVLPIFLVATADTLAQQVPPPESYGYDLIQRHSAPLPAGSLRRLPPVTQARTPVNQSSVLNTASIAADGDYEPSKVPLSEEDDHSGSLITGFLVRGQDPDFPELGAELAELVLEDRSLPAGQGSRSFGVMAGGGVHSPPEVSTHTPIVSDTHVVKGDFPGSFKVPGTNTSLLIGGFVHADFFLDFNPIGDVDEYTTADIPVPNSSAGNARFIGKRSRLWFRSATPTRCYGDVNTYVEFDFFNLSGDDLIAESSFVRSRQLWVEWNGWRFGQDYNTMACVETWPMIFDIEGPPSFMGIRTGVLRKSFKLGSLDAAVAIEQPFSDVTLNPAFEAHSPAPDLSGRFLKRGDWGLVQLGWTTRLLGARDIATEQIREYDFGWGLGLTGKLNTFGKDFALFSVTGGEGIGRYMEDGLAGISRGAFQDGTGRVHALEGFGTWGAYTHWWCDTWFTTVLYGYLDYETVAADAPEAYSSSHYGVVNLVWAPIKAATVGIEYLHGERNNANGATGQANRITIAAQYAF